MFIKGDIYPDPFREDYLVRENADNGLYELYEINADSLSFYGEFETVSAAKEFADANFT